MLVRPIRIKESYVMEFSKRLQELRKQKGMTQEELARSLYVSRTAISKWESGRGYPSIDSLVLIADFFSLTVDELLSTKEALHVAEAEGKERERRVRSLAYGLLDVTAVLLFFLPFFAVRNTEGVFAVSLFSLDMALYLKLTYIAVIIATVVWGACALRFPYMRKAIRADLQINASLALSVASILLFVLGLHPYATVFAFALLAIKVFLLFKRQ